jgi:hypothetical protein
MIKSDFTRRQWGLMGLAFLPCTALLVWACQSCERYQTGYNEQYAKETETLSETLPKGPWREFYLLCRSGASVSSYDLKKFIERCPELPMITDEQSRVIVNEISSYFRPEAFSLLAKYIKQ